MVCEKGNEKNCSKRLLPASGMYIWEAYNIKCLTSFLMSHNPLKNDKNVDQVCEKRQLLIFLDLVFSILLTLPLLHKINMCLFFFILGLQFCCFRVFPQPCL